MTVYNRNNILKAVLPNSAMQLVFAFQNDPINSPQILVSQKLTITCNSFSSIDTSEAPVDKAPLP